MLPVLTADATVVSDPELRFSPSGQAWVRLRLVCNDRVKDATGQWTDGEPMFFTAVAFGKVAENVCESVLKGDRLVVTGRAKFNEYETELGEKRKDLQIVCDSVAVGLLFTPAKTTRMLESAHTIGMEGPGRAARGMDVSGPGRSDPFGSAPPAQDPFGTTWPGPQTDEPPF